jgi:hypothetical protein
MSQAATGAADRTDEKPWNSRKRPGQLESLKERVRFVSKARKKLNAAIEAATDPFVAQLTVSLSCLIDAEGRDKGRRQRQKERTEKAKARQQPDLNLDDEFHL